MRIFVILTQNIKAEIKILEKKLGNLNMRFISEKGPKILNNLEVDASNTGEGGILNEQLLAARLFSEQQREANSAWGDSPMFFDLLVFGDCEVFRSRL